MNATSDDASSESPKLSLDPFDNPYTYARLQRLYAPRGIVVGVLGPVVVTLLPTILNALMRRTDRALGLAVPWALVVILAPLMVASGAFFNRRRRQAFHATYWIQSLAQFVWMQFLCWNTTPFFSIVGVMVFCAWAFNDAIGLYDSPLVRAQYALAFPLFDLLLLVVDAAGGRGIVYVYQHDPAFFQVFLSVQLVLVMVTQLIVGFVGAENYAHDQSLVERASIERELAVARTEREILRHTSAYVGQGLAATQFAHDVASPVQALQSNAEALQSLLAHTPFRDGSLRDALAALPTEQRSRVLDDMTTWEELARGACDDILLAAGRLFDMTHVVASAVKNADPLAPCAVHDLMARAVEAMGTALVGHKVDAPAPRVDVEASEVRVLPGHAQTLGNLLTNGALQRPDMPIEVRGRVVNEWFYLLSLRDHGVDASERDVALERVRAALSFQGTKRATPGAEEPRAYRGYGSAIMMAKVLLVRNNGAIAVDAPSSGRGLVFLIVLPRCAPDQIPADVDQPERLLEDRLSVT